MPTATDERDLTVTKTGVELVSVGIWNASTGRTRITAADLKAMVDASQDPQYDVPPLKIGHDDDRFQDANGNPPSTRDGQPAYGWVENLRVSDDGKTLIGDLVGVPRMLADVMETALRRRSVELVRHDRVGGKTYAAVLSGLALLGVQPPAVKGLADLRALFAEQLEQKPERFSLQIEDDTPSIPQSTGENLDREPGTPAAQKSGADMPVQMKLSPEQRKALGIPENATDEDIKKALAKLNLAMVDPDVPPVAVSTNPPAPVPAPAAAPDQSQQPAAPAAVAPVAPVAPAVQPAPPAAVAAPAQQVAPAPAAAPVAAPVVSDTRETVAASAAAFGLQVMDQTQIAELTAAAEDGRTARREQIRIYRDGLVRTAMAAGKIAPTAYDHFRKMVDTDEKLFTDTVEVLPVMFPTSPIGHGEQFAGGDDDEAAVTELTERRGKVYSFFNIDAPVAATPKG